MAYQLLNANSGFEAQAQRGAGAFESFAEGGVVDSERGGGLFAIAVVIVVVGVDRERQGLGEFFAAFGEAFEQASFAVVGRPRADGLFQACQFGVAEDHLAAMPAAILAPFVAHDPAQPGAEIAGDVEASDRLPGRDERVLDEVAGTLGLASQHPRIGEQRPMMIADQFGELLTVHVGQG